MTFISTSCEGTNQFSDETGMTLVELLVATMIVPIIIAAMSFGMITIFGLQSSVSNRLAGSGDAQVVSSLYVKDIQSAAVITTQPTSSPMCGGGTQLLGLAWSSNQTVISYVTVSVATSSGTVTYLVRRQCDLGNLTTPTSTTTLSYDVQSAQTSPSIVCNAGVTPCDATSGWLAASKIATVTFTIFEPTSKYTYTLSGAPRAWVAGPGVLTGGLPYAPVTLLGLGSCGTNVLTVANNGSVSVNVGNGIGNGVLAVNSPCANSVSVGINGSINAGAVITGDPGLNSVTGGGSYPSTEIYGTTLDPFTTLAPPVAPVSAGSCSTSGSTTTCSPGVYSSALSFVNGAVINFTAGNYLFNAAVPFPNNSTVTFATGQYTFGSGSAVTTGTNVTITGNNVLLYVPPSSPSGLSFGNNTVVSLTGLAAFDGVVVWNGGTGAINLANNSSSTNSYGGIYSPQGTVIVTNNGTFATQFIFAASATFSNNAVVQVTAP